MNKVVSIFFVLFSLSACSTLSSKSSLMNESVDNEFAQADMSYRQGDLSEAEWRFTTFLEKHPGFDEAWLKLGNIYVRMGHLEAAIKAFDRCKTEKPENHRCWNNLAIVHLKMAMRELEHGANVFDKSTSESVQLEMLHGKIRRVMVVPQ